MIVISPEEAWKKIDRGALVVDVRTAAEYVKGHLVVNGKGVLNVPYQQISSILGVTSDPETVIVLYCKVGGRAEYAKDVLTKAGFKNVYNAGGYEELAAAQKVE